MSQPFRENAYVAPPVFREPFLTRVRRFFSRLFHPRVRDVLTWFTHTLLGLLVVVLAAAAFWLAFWGASRLGVWIFNAVGWDLYSLNSEGQTILPWLVGVIVGSSPLWLRYAFYFIRRFL